MKTKKLTWLALLALILTFVFPSVTLSGKAASTTYRVVVSSGYLALRNDTAYSASNEIGKLYTNDTVELCDMTTSTYWFVYSPKHDKYGYVNKDYLTPVTTSAPIYSSSYTVSVSSGYLALRSAKAFDASNEIGKLYNGDTVQVQDTSDSTYWYVYSPKLGQYGYVNKNYLYASTGAPLIPDSSWTVNVSSGYLALRSSKAFDASNEIGRLYTGDTVEVSDSSDPTYWYVYSSKLGKYGYVNRNYLYSGSSYETKETRIVSVTSGYLALRSSMAFDSSNEIGKLYTGDTVQLLDTSDSTYWYVYSPKYDKNGYVNRNYLVTETSSPAPVTTKTVRVSSGYLALRNDTAYDASNEIGKLYTGDTVTVIDSSGSTYWYVYSPKLDRNGYVNKNYLY